MSAMTADDLRRILIESGGAAEFFEEYGGAPSGDALLDEPFDELGYDSLALIESAALIKRRFGVEIPDDEITEVETPRALLDLVNAVQPAETAATAADSGTATAVTASAPTAPADLAATTPSPLGGGIGGYPGLHHAERALLIRADPHELYDLVADVARWPAVFQPTVHVQHLERGEREERFRIWAVVNGQVSTWISRRNLNRGRLHIAFAQEASQAPVDFMAGEWRFRPLVGGGTEVVLRHRFMAAGDDAESVAWIHGALEHNDTRELGALDRMSKLGHRVENILFSFAETIELPGAAADVYDFVHAADRWPLRLPHVSRVRLDTPSQNVQQIEMDGVDGDGAEYTTRSIRICEPHRWIAYKQVRPPAPLLGHSGLWSFEPTPTGTRATARHTVLLDPVAIPAAYGRHTTLTEARDRVRLSLGRNSRALLSHAAAHATKNPV